MALLGAAASFCLGGTAAAESINVSYHPVYRASQGSLEYSSESGTAVYVRKGNLSLEAGDTLSAKGGVTGIRLDGKGVLTLKAKDIDLVGQGDCGLENSDYWPSGGKADTSTITAANTLKMEGKENGLFLGNKGAMTVTAGQDATFTSHAADYNGFGDAAYEGCVEAEGLDLTTGPMDPDNHPVLNITSENGSINVTGGRHGVVSFIYSDVNLKAANDNKITAGTATHKRPINYSRYQQSAAIFADERGNVSLEAGHDNELNSSLNGIISFYGSDTTVTAGHSNILRVGNFAAVACGDDNFLKSSRGSLNPQPEWLPKLTDGSTLTMDAGWNNEIYCGAMGATADYNGTLIMNARHQNIVTDTTPYYYYSAVCANNDDMFSVHGGTPDVNEDKLTSVTMNAGEGNIIKSGGMGIKAANYGKVHVHTDHGNNEVEGGNAIYAAYFKYGDHMKHLDDWVVPFGYAEVVLSAPDGYNILTQTDEEVARHLKQNTHEEPALILSESVSRVKLDASKDNVLQGYIGIDGLYNRGFDTEKGVYLNAGGSNLVTVQKDGIAAEEGEVRLKAGKDNIVTITGTNGAETLPDLDGTGIRAAKDGLVMMETTAEDGVEQVLGRMDRDTGVRTESGGRVLFGGRLTVTGKDALNASGQSEKQQSHILLDYGQQSTIRGNAVAFDAGLVDVVPRSGGNLTMKGDIKAFQPLYTEASVADAETLPTVVNTGGKVNLDFAPGSSLEGSASLGRPEVRQAERTIEHGASSEVWDAAWQAKKAEVLSWYEPYKDEILQYYTEEQYEQMIQQELEYARNDLDAEYNEYKALSEAALDRLRHFRKGEIDINLGEGVPWLMTKSSSITNLTGHGHVYFLNGGDALEVENLQNADTFHMDLDFADGSNSDMVYANHGTANEINLDVKNLPRLDAQMEPGDAIRFAVVSDSRNEFRHGKVIGYTTNGIYRDAFTVEYRDVASDPLNTDAYNNAYNGDTSDGVRKPTSAEVQSLYYDGYDNPQNVYLVKSIDDINDGTVTPGRARDIVWRYVTDLDTFTKRSGQSQYFSDEGDRGAWARLIYRNLGVDGVGEVDGNTYELGYATVSRQNDERKHRFSASLSYGRESGSWEGYGGDLKIRDFALNLYDTHKYYPSAEKMARKPLWKEDSHAYWDNYLKFHRVKTDYTAVDHLAGTRYSGDYHQNVANLSTEYGHKLKLDEKWFWVPQAQLQLSYVGGYDYTDSQDLSVSADHDWSLIGRVGFDLVKKLDAKDDSKLYLKASLLHEFLDGYDVTTSYKKDHYTDEGSQSGTWGVVGLGYSLKSGKNNYMYFDAERYIGNDFERTYDIRAGINWKF